MTRTARIRERWLLGIAIGWGVALPVLGLLAPLYRGESVWMSADGMPTATSTAATLVQVNGGQSLLVVSVPLIAAVAVAGLLNRRGPRQGPGAIATVLIAALAAGTLLAMLSVGVYVLPVTVCLAIAWALRLGAGGRPSPPVADPGLPSG